MLKGTLLQQPTALRTRGRSQLAFGKLNMRQYVHPFVCAAFSLTPSGIVLIQRRWASEANDLPRATEEKKHKCPLCEKQFLGKLALENHLAIRHNQRSPSAGRPPAGRGSFTPQSFQSLIDGYDARKIERIDRKKYSKQPLIINGKPETEEERKARLRKVIEEREELRHKSVSVTDIPLVLGLVEMWDNFALKVEDECKNDLEEGEIMPPPHVKYVPVTMEQITTYIQERKKELGYDEDAHSWMSDGIPLSVFKTANDKKLEKQSEELKKVHFGSRQLNSMTEPNPYKQQEQPEVTDLPFKCGKCGKGYRSQISMEFHYNTICRGSDEPKPQEGKIDDPGSSVKNIESTTEYFEGVPPKPIEPTSEESKIVDEVNKGIPPKNPFDKDRNAECINAHSIPAEVKMTEDNEKVLPSDECQAMEENKAVASPAEVPDMGDSSSSLSQTSSAVLNPFAGSASVSAQPASRVSNPFKVQSSVPRPANHTYSQTTSEEKKISTDNNPFKQAALEEKSSRDDGREPTKGLSDENEYMKMIEKLPPGVSAQSKHTDTADSALASTVNSQHKMLKSFTNLKKDSVNPFKSFSAAVHASKPVVPKANNGENKTQSKNPFSSFSVKATEPSISESHLPSAWSAVKASSGRTEHLQSLPQSKMNNSFAFGSTVPSAHLGQQINPSEQSVNPFLKGIPSLQPQGSFSQNNPTIHNGKTECKPAVPRESKPTCPQCGMTFRLQAALDAHISTSHTVASTLYSGTSNPRQNEDNPFQPGGIPPEIPLNPFAG